MRLPNPLDILEDYGYLKAKRLGEHSLDNALHLASGSLPIVALLEEPCNPADTAPFKKMVYGDRNAKKRSPEFYGSPTLQEIEYHVECVSYADYDLQDICVFDLNSLLSPDVQSRSPTHLLDEDRRLAQSTTRQMIQSERPKVLLALTTRAGYSDISGIQQFRCSLKSAGSMKKIDDLRYLLLLSKGFDPSAIGVVC